MSGRNVALIYARISQVQTGRETSPAVQIERCYRLALERGRQVNLETDIYADDDKGQHSAFTRKNVPQWDKLEHRALTDAEVADVIVDDPDRAYRNVRAMLNFEAQLKPLGVKLVFVSTGEVETDSPDGMLKFAMTGVLAEMHARKTSYLIRTRHYDPLRARGLWIGHKAPPGLQRVGNRFETRLEPGEQLPIVVELLRLYAADHGTRSAALELEARGLVPAGHWLRWQSKLRRILSAVDNGWYDGHIDAHLLSEVAHEHKRRAAEMYRSRRPKKSSVPLLWRLLTCPECGKYYSIAPKVVPYGKRLYWCYRHPWTRLCAGKVQISFTKARKQVAAWFAGLQAVPSEVRDQAAVIMSTGRETEDGGPGIDVQIAKLEQRLSGYEQMAADGDVSRDTFRAKKAEIEGQMRELTDRRRKTGDGQKWTYPEARQFIDQLLATDFAVLAEREPDAANRLLRTILSRVVIPRDKKLVFELAPEFAWLDPSAVSR